MLLLVDHLKGLKKTGHIKTNIWLYLYMGLILKYLTLYGGPGG